jgi:linoleoyl-CoA desaturase
MSQVPSSAPVVKFNQKDRPEFFRELKTRVDSYFKENNISRYGNGKMKLKTVFMFALYFVPFIMIVTGVAQSTWAVMLMWFIVGLGGSGIGLCVMHDANHGSFSSNQTVNKVLSRTMNMLGGSHLTWKIQHNVLHHMFTNVDGYDEDLETGAIRMSPNQKHKKMFKFQVLYTPLLYGIMTLFKLFVKDFIQLAKYNRLTLLERQGETLASAIFKVVLSKVIYFTIMIGLPLYFTDLPVWQVIVGWIIAQVVSGMVLALIFQSAHVLEKTSFYVPDENGSVENNWAMHQMHTTANFSNGSPFFSWFIGGLNYQVEHHLFPHICHVHFRAMSSIVKATAEEYGVPYYHNDTFIDALKDHFRHLSNMGKKEFVTEILTADMG